MASLATGVGFPNFPGKVTDPAARASKLNAELANYRLVMMAFFCVCSCRMVLRAVQAPVGFWDPLGFAADGDKVALTRHRYTELKHGRMAMLDS